MVLEASDYDFRVRVNFSESDEDAVAGVTHYVACCLTEPSVQGLAKRSPAELRGWFQRGVGHSFQARSRMTGLVVVVVDWLRPYSPSARNV